MNCILCGKELEVEYTRESHDGSSVSLNCPTKVKYLREEVGEYCIVSWYPMVGSMDTTEYAYSPGCEIIINENSTEISVCNRKFLNFDYRLPVEEISYYLKRFSKIASFT